MGETTSLGQSLGQSYLEIQSEIQKNQNDLLSLYEPSSPQDLASAEPESGYTPLVSPAIALGVVLVGCGKGGSASDKRESNSTPPPSSSEGEALSSSRPDGSALLGGFRPALEVGRYLTSTTYYLDSDEDGYGDPDTTTTGGMFASAPDGYVKNDDDCDDGDSDINPAAAEVFDDGVDNDCDGQYWDEWSGTYNGLDYSLAIFEGAASGDEAGAFSLGVGDVDGDGSSDVLISAPGNDSGLGAVYMVYGSTPTYSYGTEPTHLVLDDAADYRTAGDGGLSGSESFGYFMATANQVDPDAWIMVGDLADDGYVNLMQGASAFGDDGSTAATDMIFEGSSTNLIGDSGIFLDTKGSGEKTTVAIGGGTMSATSVLLFDNPMSGYSTSSIIAADDWDVEIVYSSSGDAAYLAGDDVDGDGVDDLFMGIPNQDYTYTSGSTTKTALNGGAVIAFNGDTVSGSLTTSDADSIIVGPETSNANFGSSVVSGDIDGDGYADILAGVPKYPSDAGTAYVLQGSSSALSGSTTSVASVAYANITGVNVSGSTSSDLANVGYHKTTLLFDGNGDEETDIVVSSNAVNTSTRYDTKGQVWVFYGPLAAGASLVTSADGRFDGDSSLYLGTQVSDAGDVNGDGYNDLLVGAYRYSSEKGMVVLLSGVEAHQ